MTSVSASGGRSPVRLCRIVPQTNDPPAWLKAGRAFSFLAALPAIPLRDIPATGVRRPCSIPRFARQRHGTHVLLKGRQIAFERPCRHPRTSRRELSGEVRNCHLKPSNRSSDSLNDLLNIGEPPSLKPDGALATFGIVTLYQATLGTCKGVSPLTPALVRSRRRSRPSGHRRKRRTEGLRPSEPPPKGANSPLLKPPFCRPSHVTVFLGRS